MRRRYKIHYWVQDWHGGTRRSFWWNRGDWRQTVDVEGTDRIMFQVGSEVKGVGHGASNQKHCRNFDSAMRWARRLKALGGTPLLSQSVIVKGKRYWRDYMP